MPNPIDLSKDPFFKKAFNRAETQGEAKIIANFLETVRFSVEEIAEYSKMPVEFVLQVQKQLNASKIQRIKKK